MTTKYPKIQTIFKRGEKKKIIEGEWTLPEFEYLQNNLWRGTEKIDGTNIRIGWDFEKQFVTIDGRTENANIPARLVNHLIQRFPKERFGKYLHNIGLYGEGFGAGIQGKYGKAYSEGVLNDKNANGFMLFDVKVENYWLRKEDVEDVANVLDIPVVPEVMIGTLHDAIKLCKAGFMSKLGDITAEGMVLKPLVEICKRGGGRLIAKLKVKDFS